MVSKHQWKFGTTELQKKYGGEFRIIWRGINGVKKTLVTSVDGTKEEKLIGGKLDEKSYISAFRLGTYIATQFKPNVARTIYTMTNAQTVLDTSCGWGDRLCGFYTSNASHYVGCDPNPNTFEIYKKQCVEYEDSYRSRT